MADLSGHYFHTIDAKSRLTIPAGLRASIDRRKEGYGFVAISKFDKVLYLYTPRRYEEIAPEFDASSQTNPDVRNYQRVTYGLAVDLEMDRMGRVLIPEHLVKECGFSKNVVVVGVRDHIEVWPDERWEAFVEKQRASHDELAKRVLVHEKKKAPPPAQENST